MHLQVLYNPTTISQGFFWNGDQRSSAAASKFSGLPIKRWYSWAIWEPCCRSSPSTPTRTPSRCLSGRSPGPWTRLSSRQVSAGLPDFDMVLECNKGTLLQVMFEDFGPVYQINVLRDKISGQSKGKTDILTSTQCVFYWLNVKFQVLLSLLADNECTSDKKLSSWAKYHVWRGGQNTSWNRCQILTLRDFCGGWEQLCRLREGRKGRDRRAETEHTECQTSNYQFPMQRISWKWCWVVNYRVTHQDSNDLLLTETWSVSPDRHPSWSYSRGPPAAGTPET